MPDQINYLPEVKQQYEQFPYPPRNPADEAHRLLHAISGNLLVINHHCYAGKKDFRSGFRALVAGGGTGDTVIYLAEQLRHCDAEVVYLDMSSASRGIAEARAKVRKLDNIRWITASIMDLPTLGLGEFDYIECCGVLHHLESTEAGLQALNGALKEDGAIFLMLYAKFGRQPVYDMQALLHNFLPTGISLSEQVRMARRLLAALPPSNSFIHDLDTKSPPMAWVMLASTTCSCTARIAASMYRNSMHWPKTVDCSCSDSRSANSTMTHSTT
jgi:2-polyprenyl-3-methyl-5-hydroxy-6-metoxy-1,4-benzoquinol methylase